MACVFGVLFKKKFRTPKLKKTLHVFSISFSLNFDNQIFKPLGVYFYRKNEIKTQLYFSLHRKLLSYYS